jgi:teichuronic acid biosynthesis glycosyltransferase TuaC
MAAHKRRGLKVLIVTNQWPRRSLPSCGVMVVRQVNSLSHVAVETEVIVIDGTFPSYLRSTLSVFALNFRRRRYDLIHAHTGHSGVVACLQLRYPVVFSYVGYDLDVPSDREGTRTKVERLIFRHLSRFVAGTITQSERSRYSIPRGGRRRNAVLPNGVNRALFSLASRGEARRKIGWESDAPTVLFPGDPSRYTKRFELARQAVDEARRRVPELELAILKSVPVDDVPLWMNASDVLLLTSVAEGSPNVVKEAMACNLPVVSVDVGDVRQVIEGTRHCHICPEDPRSLADALVSVVSSLPERSDGRQRSVNLDEQVIAERLRHVYERALCRGPGLLGLRRRRRRILVENRRQRSWLLSRTRAFIEGRGAVDR